MNSFQDNEGQDFFDEVQNKIETDMFGTKEKNKAPDALKDGSKQVSEEDGGTLSSSGQLTVEIIDTADEFIDTDIDDSFLEEVDFLVQEESDDVALIDRMTLDDNVETSELETQEIDDTFFANEASDFQEDDQYLGELIHREMVEKKPEESAEAVDLLQTEHEQPVVENELQTRTLADLYAEQGHYDKAIEIYERLVQENPDHVELRQRLDELKSIGLESVESEPLLETEQSPEAEGPYTGSPEQSIKRLETWLACMRTEKERRCLKIN